MKSTDFREIIKIRNERKGITLIALVVTIIVLLIIAGISVITLTGENGIITRASSAKRLTEEAELKEKIKLAYENAKIGKQSGQNEDFENVIKTELENYGYTNVEVNDNEDETYTIKVNTKTYDVDENENITKRGLNIEVGEVTIVDNEGHLAGTKVSISNGSLFIRFSVSLEGSNDLTVTAGGLSPIIKDGFCVAEISDNGKYTFNIRGSVDGDTSRETVEVNVNNFSYLPSGLTIGSLVTYEPSGAKHTWAGEYSQVDSPEDVNFDSRPADPNREEGDQQAGSDRITSWRVLDIDEDENIKLVPEVKLTKTVKLQGANGYNNAVYLLNYACKKLYSNSSLGITEVRNIQLEDIERALNAGSINTAKASYNHNNTTSYKHLNSQDQVTNAYTSYKSYPLIYAQETNSVINGISNGTLGQSGEGDGVFRKNDSTQEVQEGGTTTKSKQATNGYVTATANLKPYETYYSISITASRNAKSNEHVSALCPSGQKYWVASRCVEALNEFCWFDVFLIQSGTLLAQRLYGSYNTPNNNDAANALCPVVCTNSRHIGVTQSGKFYIK